MVSTIGILEATSGKWPVSYISLRETVVFCSRPLTLTEINWQWLSSVPMSVLILHIMGSPFTPNLLIKQIVHNEVLAPESRNASETTICVLGQVTIIGMTESRTGYFVLVAFMSTALLILCSCSNTASCNNV